MLEEEIEKMNIELQKAIEGLGSVIFWLAILKNHTGFSESQREKITKAHELTNEVFDQVRGGQK